MRAKADIIWAEGATSSEGHFFSAFEMGACDILWPVTPKFGVLRVSLQLPVPHPQVADNGKRSTCKATRLCKTHRIFVRHSQDDQKEETFFKVEGRCQFMGTTEFKSR